jgi:rod shape determining protein RodA
MRARESLRDFEMGLLGCAVVICAVGVVNLYSASHAASPGLYKMQILRLGAGIAAALVLSLMDHRSLERVTWPLYGATLVLLAAVLVVGKVGGGSQRWLDVGPVHVQPSELAKLALVLALAHHFARHDTADTTGEAHGLRDLLVPIALVLAPALLILPQPDLGTTMMIVFIGASVVLFMRVRWTTLLALAGAGAAIAVTSWEWLLREYQKDRVLTFLNPERDTLGAGYHAYQSMIAVGSGGTWGKGYLGGTQTQLSFLPEQHTDFVFSVLAEEWGFAGAVGVISLYFILILFALNVSFSCKDRFGAILALGVTAMIFWHVVVNIGMVIGVMPVVGVPLPLMSYGGSAGITVLLGIGALLAIGRRRNAYYG